MLIGKKIYATLQRRWQFRNADTERLMNITPGRYELESMENPFGNRSPWLVLKGTKIGMPEGAWHYWQKGEGDLKILIEEE